MILRYVVAVLACVVSLESATAIDLTKVDRSLKKEPAYQSKSPGYCLLVIGSEAKTRVWLVLDGDVLYIDRNGNGDLTDKGERVEKEKGKLTQFRAGDVLDADGKTKHIGFMVMQLAHKGETLTRVAGMVGGKRMFMAQDDSLGTLQFAARPQDAPVIHFDGALTMGLNVNPQTGKADGLVRSAEGEEIYVRVGTPGLGKGTFATIFHQDGGIPDAVHPVAEIEFPNEKSTGPPLKAKFIFKERCCGNLFHTPVQVPAEAVDGKAKITLSFADWKGGNVAPTILEIPIVDAKAVKNKK